MTRFHTEYELKKQDLKLNEDLFQNPEKFKEELKEAINEENHRSNVDRAKKKSVSQYFDYDKFHQMVLGADLKGMKMDDVIKIEPDKAILNPISEIKSKSNNPQDIFSGNFSNFFFFIFSKVFIQKFSLSFSFSLIYSSFICFSSLLKSLTSFSENE